MNVQSNPVNRYLNGFSDNFHPHTAIKTQTSMHSAKSDLSNFQSSFVDHSFFVYLVATLLNKIKQLLQVHCPRVENVIAILCYLETHYSQWPVNLCHQSFGNNHIRQMLLSFLNWRKGWIKCKRNGTIYILNISLNVVDDLFCSGTSLTFISYDFTIRNEKLAIIVGLYELPVSKGHL